MMMNKADKPVMGSIGSNISKPGGTVNPQLVQGYFAQSNFSQKYNKGVLAAPTRKHSPKNAASSPSVPEAARKMANDQ
jgi:hypothetical protein